MTRATTVLALAVLLAALPLAVPPPAVSAAPPDAAIGTIVKQTMAEDHLRSAIVQVRRDGQNVFTGAFGESMTGVPATADMHFRNGAMGFTYMATLLLIFADQKKLSLDDKLAKYRPDLPHASEITLRELANMTSGYADYVYQPQLLHGYLSDPFKQWAPEELIRIGVSAPMMFAPGSNWGYSHTNYAILGGVLEKVAGMPLNDALKRYVFGPMGLTQTNGYGTPYIPEPVLHAFTSERREFLGVKADAPFYEESTYWNPSWTTYDGAVEITDITDMSKSMEAVGNGSLLSAAAHSEQVGTQLIGFGHAQTGCAACRKMTDGLHYGLGVVLAGPWVTQTKFFSGSSATVAYLPAAKLTITAQLTYQPQAFDAKGNYTDQSVTVVRAIADALAPKTFPPAEASR